MAIALAHHDLLDGDLLQEIHDEFLLGDNEEEDTEYIESEFFYLVYRLFQVTKRGLDVDRLRDISEGHLAQSDSSKDENHDFELFRKVIQSYGNTEKV